MTVWTSNFVRYREVVDEKKFNLDVPDDFRYYWHYTRKAEDIAMNRNFCGGSVMIWIAFCYSANVC